MDPVKIKLVIWTLVILGVLVLWIADIVPIVTAYFWLLERWREWTK